MDLTNYDDLLSIQETAKLLAVTENTIKRYIEEGKLTAYRYVRNVRIEKSSIEQFLESSKIKPKKATTKKAVSGRKPAVNKKSKKGDTKVSE